MAVADIAFVCTADGRVGFGHLRRCLELARQVRARGLHVAFGGLLDAAARETLRRSLPEVPVQEPVEPSSLAVVDCMFDPQDPDFYDRAFLADLAARHDRVMLITSSRSVPPDLPVTAVVGHMLEPVERPAYVLYRGLEWAPVASGAAAWRNHRREFPATPRQVLVAFGNWHDPAGLWLALEALHLTDWTARVQVLLPPALRTLARALCKRASGMDLEVLAEVPSVFPLLSGADLLVGSYGNLTFEALALGVPTAVVAVKPFMFAYAEPLARQGAVVNAGPVGELTPPDLARRLQALGPAERERLSRTGRMLVDGAGLERLARLLKDHARRDARGAGVSNRPSVPELPRPTKP